MRSIASVESGRRTPQLTDDEAREIAIEAYVYAYPIVLMEITRRVSTNVPAADAHGSAPMNRIGHRVELPDPAFTRLARVDADMLYSLLWYDVGAEPLVVQVPDAHGRYFALPIFDMWTDVFASPGSRTTGTGAQEFAIVGPRWRGALPAGVCEIRSPTAQGWMVGRTQANGPADYEPVHTFQAGLRAVPLRRYGSPYNPPDEPVDLSVRMAPPTEQVANMDAVTFFSLFARVTRNNPPHANDYPILARMRRIGLEPAKLFDCEEGSIAHCAIEDAPAIAMRRIRGSPLHSSRTINGWTFAGRPQGSYGTDYLHRAEMAYYGLGANTPDDAISASMRIDADGRALDGAGSYVLHFEPCQTPPVHAFWSLTMYNARQFFAENPINRYTIGNRDALRYNPDGSLDIYVQRESPGFECESNWLPTPASGWFSLTLRLYWPTAEAADGRWKPPVLRRRPASLP